MEKIKKLEIPNQAILFTMDIDSLYTNIDIGEGIQAIKNIFQKYPDKHRPDKELLQLLEINLTRNDFEFNGDFFFYISRVQLWVRNLPQPMPISSWQNGRLLCWLHARRHPPIIIDILMTSGESGRIQRRILNNF